MAPSGTRTHSNKALCYAKLLCSPAFLDVTRGERMGGDSNPWCLTAHTLSRRAQSTALSPILSNHAHAHARTLECEHDYELKLQPAEQFIERQLNADKKFAEIRVLRAHGIKTHFVDDFFDLESVARKKRYAPFGIVEASRAGNKLLHFAGKFATNFGVTAHQFAALVKRQGIPVALFAAPFAHIVKTDHRPIGQCGVNAFLPIMRHPFRESFHRGIELQRHEF